MSAKLKTFLLTLSAVVLFMLPETRATHIVGGDMTYRCLGDNYFEITLTFTRDCEYGADDARFDNFAIVSIYDQYYNPVNLGANGMLTIPFTGDEYIQTSLEGDCEVMGYEVCVHQSVYRDTVFLLPKDGGYILSYQRCCRNSTLKNIVDPLETGSTQMIHITEEAMQECNSSPVFNSWPNIYICTNRSIDFDHSATDPDGDSLVYKLLTPYQGAGVKNPRPDRFDEFDVPYEKLDWGPGYGESNMLGSAVPLAIDPHTGEITGIPDVEGQYVVGVMVEEYRDGVLLSTVRRDFEYNVRVCLDPPVADFEAPEVLCGADEFTVDFINTSQNADSYVWYFEYPAIDKTSIEENPTYIYFENGTPTGRDTFNVYLKAIRDSDQCYDEIIKQVIAIEDDLIADFSAEIEDCPGDSLDVHLSDLSVPLNPYYNINEWNWTITLEDGSVLTGSGLDFYITIAKQKLISVFLEIGSEEGCSASIEKQIDLIFVELEFIADPIAYCIGDSSKLVSNPNSVWTYIWNPEEGLSFDDPADKSDPWCHIDHDTTYYVTVTDGVCTLEDSVNVVVQDYLDIAIDGPEYVCDDTITLIALGGEPGITIFEWAENDEFDPVIAEGDTVSFYINGWVKDYYLRVKEGTGCSNTIDSFHAVNNAIDLDYDKLVNYCYGTEKEIVLSNNRPGDSLIYTWEDSPYIISSLDSNVVTIFSDTSGEFDLVFHVINQFGCELTDTIHVESSEGPTLTMDGAFTCFTYTYCFKAFGGEGAEYHWDFGVDGTEDDVSSEISPCFDFPGSGTYLVTVSAFFEECGDTITLAKEFFVPEIFELMAEDTVGYCEGDAVMLSVVPSNFSMDINWYNEADDNIGSGIMIEYNPVGDEWITVVGIDTFGCADTVQIFLDMFEFDLTMDNPGTYCRGDTLTFGVYNNSTDEYSYQWEDNETISTALDEPLITVVLYDDQSYNVTVTSLEFGCVIEKSISVGVSYVEADIYADTMEIVITKNVDLTVEGNFNPEDVSINWSTGETTETINVSPTETSTFCVTVTDEFGCFDEACKEITVIDPPCDDTDIFIPNVFSPNDDDDIPDNNDIFRVYGKYLEEVEMVIYDRWGEEIFTVKGEPDNAYWDGTYNGSFLGPDVYAYVIRVLCQDTDTHEAQGNVSIIK